MRKRSLLFLSLLVPAVEEVFLLSLDHGISAED